MYLIGKVEDASAATKGQVSQFYRTARLGLNAVGLRPPYSANSGRKGESAGCASARRHYTGAQIRESDLEAGCLLARKDGVLHGLAHTELQSRLRRNLNRRSRRWVTALPRLSL